jgi:hypothetical protein
LEDERIWRKRALQVFYDAVDVSTDPNFWALEYTRMSVQFLRRDIPIESV